MGKIKCYLCGNEATQREKSDSSLDLNVRCPRCGRYALTHKAIYFFFEGKKKSQILNQEDKEKLSLYVQEKYDPNDGKPVIINTKIIQAVKKRMNGKCILCGRIAEISKVQGWGEYSVECDTCNKYSYDNFFERAYTSMGEEKRAMFSAYTRECFERKKDPPILGNPDFLKEKIGEYKNKTIGEKLNNLLLYLKKKSSHLGDCVTWDEKKDYPITYSPNPQEFIKILDLAMQRNLLYWRARGAGLELLGDGWEMAERLEKESEMPVKEKRDKFLVKLNEMSGGDINKFIESMKIGEELGIDRSTTFNFVRYFDQKGFIRLRADAGDRISITAKGVDEADRIQSQAVASSPSLDLGNDVFIVHGHDAEAKESVARFIKTLGLKPIILHEMANIGRTIIEKFEDHSNVGFAVVLLTPDDLGTTKDKRSELKARARQNVIFELGYFIGKLGRKRVCVLHKKKVEIPSDYKGILYVEMDQGGVWNQKLAIEMKEVGLKIVSTKLL